MKTNDSFHFGFFMKRAFSLIEILAAVAIIGIVTFLAIPNIIQIRSDSERSLAISRAEGLNLAMASFIQARGKGNATEMWATKSDDAGRYELAGNYLAFAPVWTNYMPGGYSAQFPTDLATIRTNKVKIVFPDGSTNNQY